MPSSCADAAASWLTINRRVAALETSLPPNRESEQRLSYLKARWTAPQRIRAEHKAIIKTIKSLEQGYDGRIALCCFCHALGNCQTDLHIHHINHNVYDNRLENVDVAHARCNTLENAKWNAKSRGQSNPSPVDQTNVCARDQAAASRGDMNERTVTGEAPQWSGKEGAKHDAQRHVWNKWMTDLEKGPFKGVNTKLYPSALAKLAPWHLARYAGIEGTLGSSVTYRRFIDEDIAGDILGKDEDDLGKVVVYLKYMPKIE